MIGDLITDEVMIGSIPRSGSTFLYNLVKDMVDRPSIGEYFVPENRITYHHNELQTKIDTMPPNGFAKLHGNQLMALRDHPIYTELCDHDWIIIYRDDWFYSILSFIYAHHYNEFSQTRIHTERFFGDLNIVERLLSQYDSWITIVPDLKSFRMLAYEDIQHLGDARKDLALYTNAIINSNEIYEYCEDRFDRIQNFKRMRK